jgi:hypothetical protein
MSSYEKQISHQELGDALNALQQMMKETPQNWEAVEAKARELRETLRNHELHIATDLNEATRWSECGFLAGSFLKECTAFIQHMIMQPVPKSFPNENGTKLQQAVDTEDRHASAIAKMQAYLIKLDMYMNPTYFSYLQQSKQIFFRLKTTIEAVFSEIEEWRLAEEEILQLREVIHALIGGSVTEPESQHWYKCMNTVESMLAHIQKASELSNIIEESITITQRLNGPPNTSISQSVSSQLNYYDQVAKKAKLDYHKLKTTVMDEQFKLHHLYIHPIPAPVKEAYPEDPTDLNFIHVGFINQFASIFKQLIGDALEQTATMERCQDRHTTTRSDLQKIITALSSIISMIYEKAKEIVTSIATWRPQGFPFPNFEQEVKTDRWLEFETWGKIECSAREILQSAAKANKFVTNMHKIMDMMSDDTDDYRKMEQNSLLSPLVKQIEGLLLNIYKKATQLPSLLVTHEQTEKIT